MSLTHHPFIEDSDGAELTTRQSEMRIPAFFFSITTTKPGHEPLRAQFVFENARRDPEYSEISWINEYSFVGRRVDPPRILDESNKDYMVHGGHDWSDTARNILDVCLHNHRSSNRFSNQLIDFVRDDKVTITLYGISHEECKKLRDLRQGKLVHLSIFRIHRSQLSHSKGVGLVAVLNRKFDIHEVQELLAYTLEHKIVLQMLMETNGNKLNSLAVGSELWRRFTKEMIEMAKKKSPPMIPRELWLTVVDWLSELLLAPEPFEDAHESAMKTAGFDMDGAFALDFQSELIGTGMMPMLSAAPQLDE